MIKKVNTKNELKIFIHYIEKLYKNSPYMVFPIFRALKKELRKEVLDEGNYTAILAYKDNNLVGRLMYTIDESKKQDKKVCYFSFFDCINDESVAKELFAYLEKDMKNKGINYLEGTFAPYDPDTRRGVLVKGFDLDPVIFTSYNYDYYQQLLEAVGCSKAIDTVLLTAEPNEKNRKRLRTVTKFFKRSHDIRVDSLDIKNLDSDLEDIHQVLIEATTDVIYQDAPSMDMISEVARQMKFFLNPTLVKIARENETNRPIGFCFVLPDYNQVFKKTKGRIRPLKILLAKRKITRARGMMQYTIPEYHNTGLIGYIYNEIFNALVNANITEFEAGTMMEDNPKPINAFIKAGGKITKVYRIFGKDF